MVLLAMAMVLQTAEAELPVSVAQVRARLARPAPLQTSLLELPRPTFRVEVREHPYWTDEPVAWNFTMPPMSPLVPPRSLGEPGIGTTAAGVGFDPRSAIAAARHALRERAARKEVQKAVAEFCAVIGCSQQ